MSRAWCRFFGAQQTRWWCVTADIALRAKSQRLLRTSCEESKTSFSQEGDSSRRTLSHKSVSSACTKTIRRVAYFHYGMLYFSDMSTTIWECVATDIASCVTMSRAEVTMSVIYTDSVKRALHLLTKKAIVRMGFFKSATYIRPWAVREPKLSMVQHTSNMEYCISVTWVQQFGSASPLILRRVSQWGVRQWNNACRP